MSTLVDRWVTIGGCASSLSSASSPALSSFRPLSSFLLSFAACSAPFAFPLPSFSLSRSHSPTRPRSEKEVINIAAAFRSWPSEGTKLCPRMGGVTPNPQSQNGSLRRPSPCYGGTAEVSSHLLRVRPDQGWLWTILSQSRNVLPNQGEDTLRISVARARGGPRG